MRGRKLLSAYSGNNCVLSYIKKESPNEGTETNAAALMFNGNGG